MEIKKEFHVFQGQEPFRVKYVKNEHAASDTAIAHYNTYKISILLTDGLVAVFNEQILNVEKGSILFFRPDESHFGRFLRKGVHEYLDFYLPLSFFNSFKNASALTEFLDDRSSQRIHFIQLNEIEQNQLFKLAGEIIEALNNDSPLTSTEIFSLILPIILLCAKHYQSQKSAPKKEIPYYVSHALSYINEHFSEKILLQDISDQLGCSQTYLSRIFKSYTGTTVYKHILDVRIAHAQGLLLHGATVTEACFASGFEDCSNFIQAFKRIVKRTPNQYKKERAAKK